jgi:hypothetical protein
MPPLTMSLRWMTPSSTPVGHDQRGPPPRGDALDPVELGGTSPPSARPSLHDSAAPLRTRARRVEARHAGLGGERHQGRPWPTRARAGRSAPWPARRSSALGRLVGQARRWAAASPAASDPGSGRSSAPGGCRALMVPVLSSRQRVAVSRRLRPPPPTCATRLRSNQPSCRRCRWR